MSQQYAAESGNQFTLQKCRRCGGEALMLYEKQFCLVCWRDEVLKRLDALASAMNPRGE